MNTVRHSEDSANEQTPLLPSEDLEDSVSGHSSSLHNGDSTAPTSGDDEYNPLRILSIMSVLWLGAFLAAVDTTVVATLSGPISSSFDSGTALSWIASGYLISNAACQPLSGKMTDIFGRKAGFIFATSVFTVGTFICGIAPNASVMIFGRIVAGIGGGCLNTVCAFVASDLLPLRKRGVWQGWTNIVYGSGLALGGVYGGFANDHFHWRYAFLAQIPFIAFSGILGALLIKIPRDDAKQCSIDRIDVLGVLTLTGFLVLLLFGLNSGGNSLPWSHPIVGVSLTVAALSLIAFLYVEETVAQEPLIPVRLFLKQRTVCLSNLALWCVTMDVFALMFYAPVYFQVMSGLSPTKSGLFFIPQSIGISVGSVSAGLVMSATGKYRAFGIKVQILHVVANVLIFFLFGEAANLYFSVAILGLVGFSYGAILTVTLIAIISAVDQQLQAIVTATSYAFRSIGSTMGITIASTIFQNILHRSLNSRFGQLPGSAKRIAKIRNSLSYVSEIPLSWRQGVLDSYVEAFRGVWISITIFSVIGLLAVSFMQQHKLHSKLSRT